MNWLDKHQEKILIFTWTLIILTSLFVIFTSPVQAASSVKNLPYDYSWNYFALPEQTLNIALNHASSYFNTSQDNVIVFWYEIGNGSWLYQFCVAKVDSITYDSGYTYDTTDLTLNKITLHFSDSVIGFTDGNSLIDPGNQNYAPSSFTFFGSNAILVEPTGVITQTYTHMPLYGTVVLDNKVIIGTPEPDYESGHATEPINDPDNIIDDGTGNPIARPTRPTPNPFTIIPPQFPSIDTSTLETLVESLIDVVKYGFNWIGDTLGGLFSNLLSNLGAWVDYIVQSFNYGFNNVVKAIQNLATDFYNNMVSLFEPFYNFLSGVASFFNHLIDIGTVDGVFNLANIVTYLFIPDSGTLYPIFVSHDEFNIIGITNHLFNEYRLFMSRVDSINTLHYIMIPSFTFHGQVIPQTRIDFSWFDNYKVYTDGVISAFLIVGYLYFLFTRISGWLRGNQGEVYVGDNSSNYHGTKIGF